MKGVYYLQIKTKDFIDKIIIKKFGNIFLSKKISIDHIDILRNKIHPVKLIKNNENALIYPPNKYLYVSDVYDPDIFKINWEKILNVLYLNPKNDNIINKHITIINLIDWVLYLVNELPIDKSIKDGLLNHHNKHIIHKISISDIELINRFIKSENGIISKIIEFRELFSHLFDDDPDYILLAENIIKNYIRNNDIPYDLLVKELIPYTNDRFIQTLYIDIILNNIYKNDIYMAIRLLSILYNNSKDQDFIKSVIYTKAVNIGCTEILQKLCIK